MEVKLVKRDDHYGLYNEDGHKIAATLDGCNSKLSKQNCDEIFKVIDVEEIADRHTFGQRNHEWKAYIAGFNKNAELNKDKLFTLEDVKKAYIQGKHGGKTQAYVEFDDYIQSLQQPTEIEVEIEMEVADLAFYENGERYPIEANIPERFKYKPKLDSQGCLILKRSA
jgi:hypothetical protein